MPELDELVKVTLDKERHLRLTLKGMIEFQKLTGRNLMKGFNLEELTIEDFAAFVFVCLIHEDKELKYDDVLDMIDPSNLSAVIEAVTTCVDQSFSEISKVEAGDRPLAETPPPG